MCVEWYPVEYGHNQKCTPYVQFLYPIVLYISGLVQKMTLLHSLPVSRDLFCGDAVMQGKYHGNRLPPPPSRVARWRSMACVATAEDPEIGDLHVWPSVFNVFPPQQTFYSLHQLTPHRTSLFHYALVVKGARLIHKIVAATRSLLPQTSARLAPRISGPCYFFCSSFLTHTLKN